jgi:ribonuclease D
MPGSLGELDSIGLSGSEIRFHGKTLIVWSRKRRRCRKSAAGTAAEPDGYAGLPQSFKDIKALVQEVSTEKGLSAELLASRRQINQLLNWHWQLKSANGRPELISGWRANDGRSPEGAVKEYPR